MLNTKNGRLYSLIAALCFAILGINNVVYILHYVITYNVEVRFSFIIYWIVMFGLAIALLAAKKIPSLLLTVLFVIYGVYGAIINVQYKAFSVEDLLFLGSTISCAVVLLLALNKKPILQSLWFIPATLNLVDQAYISLQSISEITLLDACMSVVAVCAYLFMGLWLKKDFFTSPAEVKLSIKPKTPRPAQPSSAELDEVESLKELKELLDTGVLTKEEFDAKKKQILGV